jgi:hypothetical protein
MKIGHIVGSRKLALKFPHQKGEMFLVPEVRFEISQRRIVINLSGVI